MIKPLCAVICIALVAGCSSAGSSVVSTPSSTPKATASPTAEPTQEPILGDMNATCQTWSEASDPARTGYVQTVLVADALDPSELNTAALIKLVDQRCSGNPGGSVDIQAGLVVATLETPEPTPTPAPTPKPVVFAKVSQRTWQLIVKSPDKYIGNAYQVWGCITQFDAATGDAQFRANASWTKQTYWYLYGDNAIFTSPASRLANFVEGDLVLMYVFGGGSYTYDTQIGGSTTVPLFQVYRIFNKGTCS